MPNRPTATDILDCEFLVIRGKLLEVAAALDRIDRGTGSTDGDARRENIRKTLALLGGDPADSGGKASRAEQLQLIFSLPYEREWRKAQ